MSLINAIALITILLLCYINWRERTKHKNTIAFVAQITDDFQHIFNATSDALLIIDSNYISNMNTTAVELFGDICNQPVSTIFYKDIDPTPSKTAVYCKCLGKDEYLFPAKLQTIYHHSSSRWILRVTDQTFADVQQPPQHNNRLNIFNNEKDSKTIIIVDDDEAVLETYRDMLTFEGWKVKAFLSGSDALAEIKVNHASILILITDYKLRNMTGIQLIKQSQEYAPMLKSIIMSGFNLTDLQLDNFTFIQKPCAREALIQTIKSECNIPTL